MHTAKTLHPDFCVIGGGPAGVTFATNAVKTGAHVVVLEKGTIGACLSYPSNALLAAGKAGYYRQHSTLFGWREASKALSFKQLSSHINELHATLSFPLSVHYLESLGITVLPYAGTFLTPTTLQAGDLLIKAKRFIIATGSYTHIPKIEGLERCDPLTSENLLAINECPAHLIIIGGDKRGVEMAQAYCRLGAEVTIFTSQNLLADYDIDLVVALKAYLMQEGITIHENVKILSCHRYSNSMQVSYSDLSGQLHILQGSHILVAAGSRPHIEELNLEAAGVKSTPRGIRVTPYLQTTSKRIYALGACIEGPHSTHAAMHQAEIILSNTLFKLWRKLDRYKIPEVIYTDPELAYIGRSEAQLRSEGKRYRMLGWDLEENARACIEQRGYGKIKVLTSPKGKIYGVSILAPAAGELIAPWALAIAQGLDITQLGKLILPYPTYSQITQQVAKSFLQDNIFYGWARYLGRLLLRVG